MAVAGPDRSGFAAGFPVPRNTICVPVVGERVLFLLCGYWQPENRSQYRGCLENLERSFPVIHIPSALDYILDCVCGPAGLALASQEQST